jgi:hypothetical protein
MTDKPPSSAAPKPEAEDAIANNRQEDCESKKMQSSPLSKEIEASSMVSPPKREADNVAVEVETVTEGEDDNSHSKKRFKVDAATPSETSAHSPKSSATAEPVVTPTMAATSDEPPVDLAETLGYKAGDHLEVQWEIHNDETSTQKTVWWKATLLEHDGRFIDAVAIRSLLYDARPDLGFPEPSQEDVVFMGHDWLINPDDPEVHLRYKREGLTEEENQVVKCSENQLDEQLNQIMMSAFAKQHQAWKAMPAAAQAVVAEKMKGMKEKLKQKLQSEAKKGHVITSETIKELLAQSF